MITLCFAAAQNRRCSGGACVGLYRKQGLLKASNARQQHAATRSRITGRRSRGGSLGLSELFLDLRIQSMPGNPHSHVSHHPSMHATRTTHTRTTGRTWRQSFLP